MEALEALEQGATPPGQADNPTPHPPQSNRERRFESREAPANDSSTSNDSSAGYPAPMAMDAGYVGMLRMVAGVDPDRWARRHGLEPWSCPCERCGTVLTTTVPFAWGCWRGLVAPLCACGHPRPPFCVSWSSMGGK